MTHTDPTTILWLVLAVAFVLLVIGSVAFHYGNRLGYRDGRQDERRARTGRPTLRTLGAMWTEQGAHDWQTETRPQERVRGWRDGERNDVDLPHGHV